jgi:hypothetical protein
MSPKLTITEQRIMPKIVHWLGFASIIGLYFFVVRPIRVGFISLLIDFLNQQFIDQSGTKFEYFKTGIRILLIDPETSYSSQYFYVVPFNAFLLVASLGIWSFNNFLSSMKVLLKIHLTCFVFNTLSFVAGFYLQPIFWLVTDLITVYLIPMASLSWVAIVYAEQKRKPS